ncbi:MAG: protein kinase [Deltaproteobacteria bacterium]|nr:protein kinase [Deltaproteobacteria bacterium]
MTDLPRIPRYDLLEEVGSGGMSVVYRAVDTTLDREVAVKVLHRHLAGRDAERKRFRQEAQAVARLSHPNILEIHDYSGEDTADAWIVSEFIRGPTLRGFAETLGFGLPTIGALVAERLARALAHAHGIGIIHRDLKPENVMVQDDGTIKLTDFGIARMVDRDTRMTTTGTLLGSPAHMAPEIIEGKGCDARSDVFSLGTVLYWLVCGSLPFQGESPAEVLRKILEGEYPDPRQLDPRVSDPLAEIVRTSMAREKEDRYQSAEEMADAIAAHLADLGLERPADEVKAFFADPPRYKESLRERLIVAWLGRAERAVAQKKIPEAIGACDAVLGLDPSNERATLLLAQMRRRRERLRAFSALGVTAVMACAAGAVVVYWPPAVVSDAGDPGTVVGPEEKPLTPTLTAGTGETEVAAAEPDAAGVRPAIEGVTEEPVEVATVTPRPEPEVSPVVRPLVRPPVRKVPRPVRILLDNWADIYIDGKLAVEKFTEAKATLFHGPHELKVVREGFVTLEESFEVASGEGVQELRRRLVPRPATLVIESAQEGVLSVGDKLIGPVVGGRREVPITFETADGEYLLERPELLKVEKQGFEPWTETVRFRPGQTVRLTASMVPSS